MKNHYLNCVCIFTILAFLLVSCSNPANQTVQPILSPTREPTQSSIETLNFDFNGLPSGLPPNFSEYYAPFEAGAIIPDVIKVNAQDDHVIIDNLGTHSGLYAIYTGQTPSPDVKISLDVVPDGSAIGVFVVCRYSQAGWYQFRISAGSSSLQLVQSQEEIYTTVVLEEGPGVYLEDRTHTVNTTCEGNQFSLSVDGNAILSKEADFLKEGSFGFGVEAYNSPDQRSAFDNLVVQWLVTAAPLEPTEATSTLSFSATPTLTGTSVNSPTPTSTPTTTLAPVSLATPRPTRIPTDELALYSTEFNDNDASLLKWTSFAYSVSEQSIVNDDFAAFASSGFYHFQTNQTNQRIYSIYNGDLGTSDVVLSLSGPLANAAGNIGLVCRYTETGWYQFMLEPGSLFTIRLVKYDEAGVLHFYKLYEKAHWIVGSGFTMQAECKGDRLTLTIDGEEKVSLLDSTFPQGKVGLTGWSYVQTGQVGLTGNFSVQRADWAEPYPLAEAAPTPNVDGAVYDTQFDTLASFSQYWFNLDLGEAGSAGNTQRTILYINDFDPGNPNIEISADLKNNSYSRGLVCRYSKDGWYEVRYSNDWALGDIVVLSLKERDRQGIWTQAELGLYKFTKPGSMKLTLKCADNQISAAIDGKTILYSEDNTWTSGRYGLLMRDSPPVNLKIGFSRFQVLLAEPLKAGDILFDKTYDSAQQISDLLEERSYGSPVQITSTGLILGNSTDGFRLWSKTPLLDTEVTVEMEFLNNLGFFILGCRAGAMNNPEFQLRSDGSWALFGSEAMLAVGQSTAIHPDLNQITLRCEGNQVTAYANGETITTVELPKMDPEGSGGVGVGGMENIEVSLKHLNLLVLKGPDHAVSPAEILNRVSLPEYSLGEVVFQTDFQDWYPAFSVMAQGTPNYQEGKGFVTAGETKPIYMFYRQQMNDLPVEMETEAAFSGGNSGGLGFFCRDNGLGRYEFLLQKDGHWFIRRNTSYSPRIDAITILAYGQVNLPAEGTIPMTATCNASELAFSVNGEEVGRVTENLYPEGKLGLWFDANTLGYFVHFSIQRTE